MDKPAISVIIAMFNAQEYIADCLSSLANQTLRNFEIIIADDCSSDNSLAVVENFSTTFGERLKVMKLSANSGCPGIPRNFALEAARGKYIAFMDSDDLLSETALEDFLNVAEKFNADVVHSEKVLAFVADDGEIESKILSTQPSFVTEPTLETFDIAERVNNFVAKKFMWQACGKLFRRKFLTDNKITFPALKTFEDMIFVLKCIVAAKNYVRVPAVNYYYRAREDSLSHKVRDGVEISADTIKVVNALDDFMNGKKFFRDNVQCRYALIDFFIRERLEVIAKNFFVTSKLEPAEVFDFFREKIFSAKSNENAALMAYLFVTAALKSI